MLAKANRLLRGSDYRTVVRRGQRVRQTGGIYYVKRRADAGPARFGFIVTKAIGSAPVRNRVRRRLKAGCYAALPSTPAGLDVVIRALPASIHLPWTTVQEEIFSAVSKGGAQS